MAFFFQNLCVFILHGKDICGTVLIQLKLNEGKRPTEKKTNNKKQLGCWGTKTWTQQQSKRWTVSVKSRMSLPPAADAGHVGVKLAGEAAAGSPLQEGGPDGRLEELPPILVQFWKTDRSATQTSAVAWAEQTWPFFFLLLFKCSRSHSTAGVNQRWKINKRASAGWHLFLCGLFDQQGHENVAEIFDGVAQNNRRSPWCGHLALNSSSDKTLSENVRPSYSLFSYSSESCVLWLPA